MFVFFFSILLIIRIFERLIFFFSSIELSLSYLVNMSSASAILTALSDLTNNPKLEKYDPHVCKDIHIKLDKEARDQGLSFEERFEMVK